MSKTLKITIEIQGRLGPFNLVVEFQQRYFSQKERKEFQYRWLATMIYIYIYIYIYMYANKSWLGTYVSPWRPDDFGLVVDPHSGHCLEMTPSLLAAGYTWWPLLDFKFGVKWSRETFMCNNGSSSLSTHIIGLLK